MSQSKQRQKTDAKILPFTYLLLLKLDQGQYAKQIAIGTERTRQAIQYHIRKLEKDGLIERDVRTSCSFYRLTNKGRQFVKNYKLPESKHFSPPITKARHNNFVMKFPILIDNPEAKWQEEVSAHTWVKKKDILYNPVPLTIIKTTKNVLIYVHEFETDNKMFLSDYIRKTDKARFFVYFYLKKEKGIEIDLINGETISEETAKIMPELEGEINPSKKTMIQFQRDAQSFYPTKTNARAWIDNSKGKPEVETNDMLYEEKVIMMPERIEKLEKAFDKITENQVIFAENLATHLKVLEDMSATLKAIRDGLEVWKDKPKEE